MNPIIMIQNELKAPKTQFNSFGNYYYRNCEDILEAVKPLLKKYKCYLTITDEIVLIGTRFYIKATATLFDENDKELGKTSAFAREPEAVKGQSDAQITGASSSYARKYALNGLFDIDDTKDSDTTNNGQNKEEKQGEDLGQTGFVSDEKEQLALNFTLKSGKYSGQKLRDCPIDYLEWASKNLSGKWQENAKIAFEWKKKQPPQEYKRKNIEGYDLTNDDIDGIPFL